jgi:hypothetical protein
MGYYGKLQDKLKAQELRRNGLSYKEIMRFIPVSKNSISRWCRDIELSEDQLVHLNENKIKGSIKGRMSGAKKQQELKKANMKDLFNKGVEEIGVLSFRERFILGVAFYIAEGTKFDGKLEFTNADPYLIKFMVDWLRTFCEIKENRLRGSLWIHEGLDEGKAKKFWANLTQIPISQFQKSYIAKNKENSSKIRKNLHNFGVFSLRYSDVKLHRKLIGWSSGLLGKSWYNN